MPLLGIETSTRLGGLALLDDDGGLVGEVRIARRSGHSEGLMVGLERLLRDAELNPRDLTAVAVSAGPGSFTGLRVAISTAKGMAFGRDMPVLPVSSLAALVHPLRWSALPVCPVVYAKKDEVYAAVFETGNGDVNLHLEETPIEPGALMEKLDRLGRRILLTGDGARRHRENFLRRLGDRAVFAPLAVSCPSPVSVAEIGFERLRAGDRPEARDLSPRYLKLSEAERKWAAVGTS